ncbi:MAG: hypothetical protein NTU53_09245 [Planctomycetota bacterium]|nr:hypothetical protein [Planctomycetota bacterium]
MPKTAVMLCFVVLIAARAGAADRPLGDNPEPMNVISVHAYGLVDIAPMLQIVQVAKRPLFVGEFGVPGADERAREQFGAMLGWVEWQAVPLAALWVYDYAGQNGQWNVTVSNERSYQLKAVSEANRRVRERAGQNGVKREGR